MSPSHHSRVTTPYTNYKHDMFVSYAHVDNELIGDDKDTAWVTTLCVWLKNFTEKRLGSRVDIWRDPRLPGSEPLTPELKEAVANSASLLVILSEGFLKSEWCQAELRMFMESAGGPARAAGRIFVVQSNEIERERWPKVLVELPGYEFFEHDISSGMIRTLGVPKPDPNDKLYTNALLTLSTDWAHRLERTVAQNTAPQAPRTTTSTTTPSTTKQTDAATEIAPDAETPRCTVFLAEVTPDLERLRNDVRDYLRQAKVRVLPQRYYARTPTEFEKTMAEDLDKCDLFVQMLGPFASMRTEDLPRGYEGLQLDIARRSNVRVLRWRSPDLELESVTDEVHLEVLQEADVQALRIEDFKEKIINDAETIGSHQSKSESQSDCGYVVVKSREEDREFVERLVMVLENHGLDYEVSEDPVPCDEILKVPNYCHGLIVVHGACQETWVLNRLRECRIVKSRIESAPPIWAYFEGPPPDGRPVMFKLAGMVKVNCRETFDEQSLGPFISAVKERCNHD